MAKPATAGIKEAALEARHISHFLLSELWGVILERKAKKREIWSRLVSQGQFLMMGSPG